MTTEKSYRQYLLSILSKSTLADIKAKWEALSIAPTYYFLKKPEIGMAMVKAKAGGTGQPFNMGEMTVTRCVIKLDSHEIGYGYTAGRDKMKSELIALIDACFQITHWTHAISEQLIQPLATIIEEKNAQQRHKVEATKVNFYTMVRGE